MDNRLFSNIKPVIIYLKALGLLPISFTPSEIKLSIFEIIFGISVKIIFLIFYFTRKCLFYEEPDDVGSVVFNFEMMSFALLTLLCQLLLLWRSKILLNISLQVLNFSKEIKNSYFYKLCLAITVGQVFAIFGFELAYNVSYCHVYPFDCKSVDDIVVRVVQSFGILTLIGVNILFGNVLLLCGEFLKLANNKLIKFHGDVAIFEKLVVSFNDAHTLCINVNRCFGPSMAVSTITTLFEFIVGCYFVVSEGMKYGIGNQIVLIAWLVPFGILLWFMLFGCEEVVEQVKIVLICHY